jgi:hypothetical protein
VRRVATTLGLAALAAGVWAGETRDGAAAPRPVAVSVSGPRTVLLGRSARGVPIRAVRVGDSNARVSLLVVGSIHGNEPAGRAIVARLRRSRPPPGTALWLVADLNPDGQEAGTRHNARGVDLNRNFPYRWRPGGGPFDTYYPGAGPLSEPESRAAARFIARVRPRVTLWYHQALGIVVRSAGDAVLERMYARRAGLPRHRLPRYHGTAVSWQNHRFPGDTAFVVELPGGEPSSALVGRHADATLALARAVAPQPVVARPIPFGARRRAETRAYARRHYGIDDFRLRHPRVIVEHYTASETFEPVYQTFARDVPDVELGELPAVCAHYVIDRDGTVYRLVPTKIMCRHTVGLNWTAIGIEHVGTSDAEVLGNRRQMRASLRLTRSLQGRFRISDRNVIGHAESLSSPYHRERVGRLRRQTHGDLARAAMRRYRRRLARLPAPSSMR